MNWQGITITQENRNGAIHIEVESDKYNADKRYQREHKFNNLPR